MNARHATDRLRDRIKAWWRDREQRLADDDELSIWWTEPRLPRVDDTDKDESAPVADDSEPQRKPGRRLGDDTIREYAATVLARIRADQAELGGAS